MPQLNPRPRRLVGALAIWLLALTLAGCESEPPMHQDRLLVFGTLVDISLYGLNPAEAQQAIDVLERQFRAQHLAWSPVPPGQLADLNRRLAAGEAVEADPELLELLRRGRALSEDSGGLFNPAIGGLVRLWGFQRADEALPTAPPDPAAVQALLAAAPRMSDLEVNGATVRSHNPALQLDFGAFAKGYAVDQALDTLRRMGVTNALVNAGGDLRALGRPGDRRWRIGVRHPRGDGVMAALEIEDGESVFTSGDYERYFDLDGTRYHHILDPRTGAPATGTASVTLIHDDATTADAAATALFVAGPEGWAAVARAMGLNQVMLIDQQGRAHMTRAMAERVRFVDQPPEVVIE